MADFAAAAKEADDKSRPVVRGYAIQFTETAGSDEAITARLVAELGAGFVIREAIRDTGLYEAIPADDATIPLNTAWEKVYRLRELEGVAFVEPLLLVRVPVPKDPENAEATMARRGIWGFPYPGKIRRRGRGSRLKRKKRGRYGRRNPATRTANRARASSSGIPIPATRITARFGTIFNCRGATTRASVPTTEPTISQRLAFYSFPVMEPAHRASLSARTDQEPTTATF
jgi:hypothetical protein